MSKQLKVYYRDGESEQLSFPDSLTHLPWPKYRKIERKIKMNAELGRDGEVKDLTVSDENLGDFFVELQQEMAQVILDEQNIDIDDVTAKTVKTIVEDYSEGLGDFNLKKKKE